MRIKVYWFIFSFILFGCNLNCNYSPGELTKLTHDEIVEVINHEVQVSPYLVIKNRCGIIASKEELKQLNDGSLSKDQYVNDKGEIVKFVLRDRTIDDNLLDALEIQAFNELEQFEYIPIDCDSKEEKLLELYYSDQSKRTKNLKEQDGQTFSTRKDQTILMNLFQQCGFINDTSSEKTKEAAFLVIQHASNKMMAQYYPKFLAMAQKGQLDWKYIALMEDRILVSNGFPQLYGTQLSFSDPPKKKYTLYPIIDSINVNKRRKELGLIPLDKYLAGFNL